ncbi:hypothetical protein C8Q76DRAFT_790147 [Earliella scabrosa]|nr:hypothetical protein C8Q76DRAFT_790147 [Earliella scabrosa]
MTTTDSPSAHIGTITRIDHSIHTSIQLGSPVSSWDVVAIWRRLKKNPKDRFEVALLFGCPCHQAFVPWQGRVMVVKLYLMFRGGKVSTDQLRRLVKAQTIGGMWKEAIHSSPCQYGASAAKNASAAKPTKRARRVRVLSYEHEIMVILDEALALSEVRIRDMEWQEKRLRGQMLEADKRKGVKELPNRLKARRAHHHAVKDVTYANKIQCLLRVLAGLVLCAFAPTDT